MAKKRIKGEEKKILKDAINQYEQFLKDNSFTNLDVDETKLEDELMDELKSVGYEVRCPNCDNLYVVKNGKAKSGLQKYKCKNCGKIFTIFTNTVFDSTRYPISVIFKLIYSMIDANSISILQNKLLLTYPNTYNFDLNTLSLLRLKIMMAIHESQIKYFTQNPLTGIVQIDETYFHENQSGTKEINQYNPHVDIKGQRTSLKKVKGDKIHSKKRRASVKSDDFSNVVVAVNSYGYCIGSLIGIGLTDSQYLNDNIMKYIDFNKVTILCSDGNSIFDDYCIDKDIIHYILPSAFYKESEKIGTLDAFGNEITERELFESGKLGTIKKGSKRLGYSEFKAFEAKYFLSLKRVNGLHSELKSKINRSHNSVVSKNLQYYVSWYCFLRNYHLFFQNEDIHSHRALYRILAIALQQDIVKLNIKKTNTEIKNKKISEIPRITSKDMKHITKIDKEVKTVLGSNNVSVSPESYSYKSTTDVIKSMRKGELQDFGLFIGLKNVSTMKVEEIRKAMYSIKDIKTLLIEYDAHLKLIKTVDEREYSADEYLNYISKQEAQLDRKLTPSEVFDEFFKRSSEQIYKVKGKRKKGKDPEKTLFLDIETTGLDEDAEILELAIIDGSGNTKFHCMFKPDHHTFWKKAEEINGISPKMVETMDSIQNYTKILHNIFRDADELVIYNLDFDIKYIKPLVDGRIMRKLERTSHCCMKEFQKKTSRFKRGFKLIDAVQYYKIDYNKDEFHGALYDAQMTRHVWNHIFPTYF